jgi:hypothetical protein
MNLDLRQLHTWLIYAVIMAFYTFSVFCIPFNRENAPLFSNRKMKNPSAFILTHMKFLLILLVFMWSASCIEPRLPNWMTSELYRGKGGSPISASELLCGILFLVLLLVERLFIYLKSDTNDSDSENNHS